MIYKLLLYCTKAKPYLYRQDDDNFELSNKINYEDISGYTKYYGLNNGKIVAECDFEVEEITYELYGDLDWQHDYLPTTDTMAIYNLEDASCLDRDEIENYLKGNNGYAIHIKNLHIFDKPKELSEYMSGKFEEWDYRDLYEVKKAPQNMQYVSSFYSDEISMWGDTYILISIKPQWLCKILNGEKTVDIRKKVLKEML